MKRIALFTSGGDSPGMNAAIRAVVRAAHHYGIEPYGIYRGYQGLIENDIEPMGIRSVNHILGRGGTVLKSARCPAFRTEKGRKTAYQNLVKNKIDGLVAIGGDGTFTGAHILAQEHDIPIVGIPGTIDNDLYGTDYTLGFDTATHTVVSAVDNIRDTASSHNRLFFVEVMGRDTGFIALRSGIASGALEVMVPETTITPESLVQTLNDARERGKTSSIIMVAEGNENGNAHELAQAVTHATNGLYDIRVTVLGHLQRGGRPTCFDRILASELGVAAVEALIHGKRDIMVGRSERSIVETPFKTAISQHKEISKQLLRIQSILSA